MVLLCVIFTCARQQGADLLGRVLAVLRFLNAFSFFDALVIDTLWFCHSKWWKIPGTEDMTEAYHDYAFHWKWFLLSLIAILPLSAIIGGAVLLVGRFF